MTYYVARGRGRPRGTWITAIIGALVLMLLSCMMGCGTLSNERRWGDNAFSNINSARISRAAQNALLDVKTLLPATAAVLFAAADFDEPVSDWIMDRTILFQSPTTARKVSDYLNWALQAETLATLLATPSGDDTPSWLKAKAKGFAAEAIAAGIPAGTTQLIKHLTNRTRPDRSDRRSFPSGHASSAFSMTTLANRNLDDLDLHPGLRSSLQVGNITMASLVGWARIAGGKHFPSDVLAGAAIGHFFSAFFHDVLLGPSSQPKIQITVLPSKDETMAYVIFPF